jgi:hypothetical protein
MYCLNFIDINLSITTVADHEKNTSRYTVVTNMRISFFAITGSWDDRRRVAPYVLRHRSPCAFAPRFHAFQHSAPPPSTEVLRS